MDTNFSYEIVDRINKNFSKVNKILNLYLRNLNEKNIHDIRKSIRRAESAYMTLPREYRKKKKIREYIDVSKNFFKLNSQIRDYDIYLQKIDIFKKTHHPKKNSAKSNKTSYSSKNNYNNNNNDIESQIQNLRKSKLRNATTVALQLQELEYPQIKKNKKKIYEEIDSRFNRVKKKFLVKIEENFPIVINDESKLKELHTLRKDCKRLRYLLELKLKSNDVPKDHNNNHDDDNDIIKSIINLEDIQDYLGKIHDCDAFLSFFEKFEEFPEKKPIMNIESKNRKDLYGEFVNKYRTSNPDLLFHNL